MKKYNLKTNGLFIYYFGEPSKVGFQIYWPEIQINSCRFFFSAANIFLLTFSPEDKYYNFGFKILGFGFGLDYAGELNEN